MNPCPNCGVAGNNFACTNHIISYGPPSVALPVNTDPGTTTQLLAEIARLSIENNRLREENEALREFKKHCSCLPKLRKELERR